eukprot:CAMPEP_0171930452 /NCGR_PEP_ID=MMETSP0993-20121228/28606_1 /TAXON_ID=483369 /ORGANISM="non described non described, Strain CCMP2098" /LENGTH=48 /DNA_ID= /DNA_START= /DNA_END= /DNA_ORIENTATION=
MNTLRPLPRCDRCDAPPSTSHAPSTKRPVAGLRTHPTADVTCARRRGG